MKKPSLVLLAKTDKSEATASKFVCRDTKQTLFTNVAKEALSPFSGASFLRKSPKTVTLDKELVASYEVIATCPSCETEWLASQDFIKSHSSFHCVVCNEQLETNVEANMTMKQEEADALYADDLDIIINDDVCEEILPESTEEEAMKMSYNSEGEPDENAVEITQPIEDCEEEAMDHMKSSKMMEAETETLQVSEEPKVVVIEINNPESVVVAPEEVTEDALPDELSEQAPELISEEGIETPEDAYEANLTYNLAHLLNKPEYANQIELIASTLNKEAPAFYIAVNSVPVAVAEFAKASEAVRAMFSDADLVLRSLQVTLSNSTNEEGSIALKDFGIRPIVVPVISEKAAVASNVAKITRELTAAFKKKEAEMFNVWRESFSTAALMYCKGLQKKTTIGKQKSLITKASLIETLKSVGINNADLIVEEAFKRGIQRDYGVIVEEALSLYSKTPEARKEVRDFVADAEYTAAASLASDQATVSEAQDLVPSINVKHQSLSSVNEDFGSAMAFLKGSIHSRAI